MGDRQIAAVFVAWTVAGCLVTLPAPAHAGIPTLAVVLPELLLLSIPMIVVEAQVLLRWLELGFGRAFALSALANLASTLVGVPLAWTVLRGIEAATIGDRWIPVESLWDAVVVGVLQAAWIPDTGRGAVLFVSFAWLMLVFFAVSWLIEWAVIRYWLMRARAASPSPTTQDRHAIARPVMIANAISYGVAFLGLCVVVLPSSAF
jgi:hypothetical protein